MAKRNLPPVHPGEILYEDFLKPMNITPYKLAKEIHVGAIRVSEIIHGSRSITADTALRLARFFNMSAEFWMNAQAHYDLETARIVKEDKINKEIHPYEEAA
jgi:antitoxin HigA-1